MASRETTVLLGVEYPGLPLHGSLALDLYCTESMRGREAAQALLDAHNKIAAAFNQPPIDLSKQFSKFANSMAATLPNTLAYVEAQDRPINRVVTKTARAA
jgi:hypothetical protein